MESAKKDAVIISTPETNVPVQMTKRLSSQSAPELQRLLDEEIIERVNASEWISPIVVVQKKSGGVRLCVDLRELSSNR
ncbi:hypothetical protein M513_06502 [Trichuris suis]|uniref:Reverse transcriptase domain-containing protein n=1 Tax=Trichuris suis TaxID=68888 RepID=A0A085M609_9BILA|nr:hypothetical protein M513_06502 [Trichuris suis]